MTSIRQTLLSTILCTSLFLIGISNARADENTLSMAFAKAEKTVVINNLQASIVRHQRMSKDEILSDMKSQLDRQVQQLKDREVPDQVIERFAARETASLDRFGTLDRDTILAVETMDLQRVMTSDNMLFFLTAWGLTADGWFCGHILDSEACALGVLFLVFPVTSMIDCALLPIEVLLSVVAS